MTKPKNLLSIIWQQDRRLVVAAFGLGLLTWGVASALMFTSGYLIAFAARRPAFAAIYVPVVLTRAFGIGRPVFQYLQRLSSHSWVLGATSRLRRALFAALAPKLKVMVGNDLSLLTEDLEHLQNTFLRLVLPVAVANGVAGIAVIGLAGLDWRLAIGVAVGFAALLWGLPLIFFVKLRPIAQARQAVVHAGYQTWADAVLGLNDWVLAKRPHAFAHHLTASFAQRQSFDQRVAKLSAWRDWWAQLGFVLLPAGLLAWSAQAFDQNATAANWIAGFALCALPLNSLFSGVVAAWAEWPKQQVAWQRLSQALQPAPPVAAVLPQAGATLHYQGVGFAYPEATPLLEQIELTVAPGQKVALLGASGVGKTTLLQLAMGELAPTVGQISGPAPDQFAVLEQHPYLFHTTIAANLRLALPDASDEALNDALAAVQLDALVAQLPQGLDTPVAESGFGFSGGEMQRLALARVLLQDRPWVLLDEPTVGLDPITEAALRHTIFTALAGKTLIWLTHHLQGIAQFDRVVWLEAKHITMNDTPAQLAATNAHYRHLLALEQGGLT